ncbi:putative ankyrin repeat protein [Xenohaliotis phage pCXc-HC2016]|nr:putative ankyrin repeat protein [Xenohaliotis phage pCXc-HC2016]AQW89135.1 putative ankyrin repeat protein [Xenohaliotis phage pCXc-HR2015]
MFFGNKPVPDDKLCIKGITYQLENDMLNPTELLCHAVNKGSIMLAEMALKHNADVNGFYPYENTLLDATENNDPKMVRLLLEHNADPNRYNERGHTPLMVAAQTWHIGIVKILLEYKADIHQEASECEHIKNVLDIAIDAGDRDIIKLLKESGAVAIYHHLAA